MQQDKEKGALKQLATNEGYETFIVPDDVGGRYSVLTAVGLLPIATAGINIEAMMIGAAKAREELSSDKLEKTLHTNMRQFETFYMQRLSTEMLINYEPSMQYFNEWWKQLFGESEGKDFKVSILQVPTTQLITFFSQYVQEGRRFLFETVVKVNHLNMILLLKR